MADAATDPKPFKVLTALARNFLGISQADWRALDEETRKKHVQSARRALKAIEKLKNEPDEDKPE